MENTRYADHNWIKGWVCVLGWQAGAVINAYLAATEIQGLIVLNNPNYEMHSWHGTLLLIAVAAIAIFFNTFLIKKLSMIEGMILMLHIFGFFAILIPLWVTSPRKQASEVFFDFQDNGDWGSIFGACFLGVLSPVFSFIGMSCTISASQL